MLKDVERDQVEVVLEAQVGFVLKDGEGDAGDVDVMPYGTHRKLKVTKSM